MMTSKELKELKNKYLSILKNKRSDVIYMIETLIKVVENQEKLEKAIDIIIREKMKPVAFLGTLRNYKECYKVDMPYERSCILLDCDINEEEFELLKEVLGNE